MTLDDFRQSLTTTLRQPDSRTPSPGFGGTQRAIGSGRTNPHSTTKASRDRGLHCKEGDHSNAAYWYSRAGKPVCRESLDAEWLGIVKALLS